MTTAIVSQSASKDEMTILGASDDRELLSQGLNDFLPYDLPFEAIVEVQEVRARKNYDNRGVFVNIKVLESSAPREVQVGKVYAVAFFDEHKSLPEFVVTKMIQARREFAAAIAGADANDEAFKSAKVLLQLHNEVEPLGIKMVFSNRFVKTTRNGKKIHELGFKLAE